MSANDTAVLAEHGGGFCAICMSDVTTLAPIRLIHACQHSFHVDCLDEWLIRRAECPLCRRELPSYTARAKERAGIAQIQEVIRLLERDVAVTRAGITYAVITELLRRYPRAVGSGGLHEASERIQGIVHAITVNGVHPELLALNSRYALCAQARALRRTLAEQLGCQAANVHRQERVMTLRHHVRNTMPAL